MMAAIVCPFTTVADAGAPARLTGEGFHRDSPVAMDEIRLWHERGDVVVFRPHPNLPGMLTAEITAADLSSIVAIVEPGQSSPSERPFRPCRALPDITVISHKEHYPDEPIPSLHPHCILRIAHFPDTKSTLAQPWPGRHGRASA